MRVNLSDVVNKAEEFHKQAGIDYEESVKAFLEGFNKLKLKMEQQIKEQVSPIDVLIHFLDGWEIKSGRQVAVIQVFKMEQEAQQLKRNDDDRRVMAAIVLEELQEFYLPQGMEAEVISEEELRELLGLKNNTILPNYLQIILLSNWIYYPLSFPFQLIRIFFIAYYCVRPAIEEATLMIQESRPFNMERVLDILFSKMPTICQTRYWYHHIISGVLLWILIFLWWNK